ncbi:hypothetical protein [Neptuniibacter sp. QD37_11]|uniref:hypothetical protein n=1 Tax=Neptuniibacter sp. QD37_11 TaxID=3398209 RepID=UPI0039F4DE55
MTNKHYPQCEKLSSCSNEVQSINEFLEWCQENGFALMDFNTSGDPVKLQEPVDRLIHKSLGVDVAELEAERQDMIANLGS